MCKFLQYMHCWCTWTVDIYPESDVMVSWWTSYLHITAVNDEKRYVQTIYMCHHGHQSQTLQKTNSSKPRVKSNTDNRLSTSLLHYFCRIHRYNAANSSANGINVYSRAQRNPISSVWHSGTIGALDTIQHSFLFWKVCISVIAMQAL